MNDEFKLNISNRLVTLVLMTVVSIMGGCSVQNVDSPKDDEAVQHGGIVQKPNLIILMADDLGYSDVGAFGGEINTPNIDALARSGVLMTNFYGSLTCSPSRAMLMSGADNHLAGLGNMGETLADNQLGLPGYEGHLNDRVVSLAQALKSGGYQTYMAGKWHLGLAKGQGPAERGFDESFALLFGGASHYDNGFGPDAHRTVALYRDNGKLLDKAPEGFFSSDYYTSRIIQSIDSGADKDEPFFAYLAFTAPHWPLQFPPNYSGQYADTYKEGWQAIREQRLKKQQALGLIPDSVQMAPSMGRWDELTDEQQALSAKKMEIYASMVEDMDANIGRLIEHLKSKDLYDNTVVVFLSDNGADSWSKDVGPPVVREWAKTFNNSHENAGQPDSFVLYGGRWANVSNTPFKDSKGNTSEGGIRIPMIMHLPEQINRGLTSGKSEVPAGIEDIMPTFLDLAGVEVKTLKNNQVPITGRSLLGALAENQNNGANANKEPRIVGRELWGKRGIRVGDWKLINQPPPSGNSQWQLYNLEKDLAEQVDLAVQEPEKLAEMLGFWQAYVESNNVVLPEGGFRIREVGELPSE